MPDSSWTNIGVIAAVVALFLTVGIFYYQRLCKDLENPENREIWADLYERASWWAWYQAALSTLLDRADRFFRAGQRGERVRYGGPTWTRCLQIAYIYPIALLIFAWALSGANPFGKPTNLVPVGEEWKRWVVVALLVLIIGFFYWYFSRDIAKKISLRLVPRRQNTAGALAGESWRRRSLRILAYIFGNLIAVVVVTGAVVAVAVSFSVAIAFAVAVTVVGAVAVVGTAALQGAVFGAAIVIGLAVGSIIIFVSSHSLTSNFVILVWFIFIFLLPLANSLLDYLSLRVTRFFLEHIKNADAVSWRDRWSIIGELCIDAVLAFSFLVVLAAVIPALLGIVTLILNIDGMPVVRWPASFDRALVAPYTDGLLVTGMLLTTLVPTAVHFGAACFALIVLPGPNRAEVVTILRREGELNVWERRKFVRYKLAWRLPLAAALGIAAAAGIFFAISVGLEFVTGRTFGETLYWIAAGVTQLFL